MLHTSLVWFVYCQRDGNHLTWHWSRIKCETSLVKFQINFWSDTIQCVCLLYIRPVLLKHMFYNIWAVLSGNLFQSMRVIPDFEKHWVEFFISPWISPETGSNSHLNATFTLVTLPPQQGSSRPWFQKHCHFGITLPNIFHTSGQVTITTKWN